MPRRYYNACVLLGNAIPHFHATSLKWREAESEVQKCQLFCVFFFFHFRVQLFSLLRSIPIFWIASDIFKMLTFSSLCSCHRRLNSFHEMGQWKLATVGDAIRMHTYPYLVFVPMSLRFCFFTLWIFQLIL